MPQFDKWIENLSADDSVDRVVRQSMRLRLKAVEYYLPLAANHPDESIEHVHQLRVCTRRALAAFDLFTEFLPKSTEKWFRKALHKIRRAAGKARDLDVLIESHRTDKGKGAREFLVDLQKRRRRAQKPIVAIYHKYFKNDRFSKHAKSLQKKSRHSHHESFGSWATVKLKAIAKPFFKTASFDIHNLSKLHRFRIRGKELRYAMELLAPAFQKSFRKKLYPTVEGLQNRIGEIHDHAVAIIRFEKWLAKCTHGRKKEHLAKLLEAEQQKLEQLLCAFHSWWTPEFELQLHDSFDRLTE